VYQEQQLLVMKHSQIKRTPRLSFLSILGYWVGVVDWILVGQDGPEFYHILALKDQEVKYASIAEYTYLVIERRMTEKGVVDIKHLSQLVDADELILQTDRYLEVSTIE